MEGYIKDTIDNILTKFECKLNTKAETVEELVKFIKLLEEDVKE